MRETSRTDHVPRTGFSALLPDRPGGLGCHLFIPADWDGKRWAVSICGYTRNAAAHVTQLAPEAASRRCALACPVFRAAEYPAFQKLAPSASGVFPEDAFAMLLERLSRTLGVGEAPAVIGYSGGGQFLHRALMVRPGFAMRAVLFAPGWYTWPDPRIPFPYGMADSAALGGRSLSLRGMLLTPMVVMVGDRDTHRDGTLNTKPLIDRVQGTTRVERAGRWVDALSRAAEGPHDVTLRRLRGVGHDFTRNIKQRGVGRDLFDAAFPETATGIAQ